MLLILAPLEVLATSIVTGYHLELLTKRIVASRTSGSSTCKAEGSNPRRRCMGIVEDRFVPDNAAGRRNKPFECKGVLLDALRTDTANKS